MALLRFLRNWTLPVSMLAGVCAYFLLAGWPAVQPYKGALIRGVELLQPVLIFTMLFLSFCKVEPRDLRLKAWQGWLLLLQSSVFALLCVWLMLTPRNHWRVVIEGAMLCMVCPTATAATVVTGKLGGNTGTLTTYIILINLAVALLIPAFIPLVHPSADMGFAKSSWLIVCKVFPLLFCPFLLALIVRRVSPRTLQLITSMRDLAFYIWAFSLALAIAVTTRSIVHTSCPLVYQAGIALASLLACLLQFTFGRWVGRKYGEPIAAAQACGQKNTVFAIWVGYTFLTPVTSIAGGFYSVWHNVFNSWQLYQLRKKEAAESR